MQEYIDAFFGMGVYAYVVIGVFVLAAIFAVVSAKMNKGSITKWKAAHPGCVKVCLKANNNVITQQDLRAQVLSGEAAVFMESMGWVVYAMPGDVVIEVTYSYTRPGVLHKTVTTTWGPSKVELHLESGKDYTLAFDRDEERFNLVED